MTWYEVSDVSQLEEGTRVIADVNGTEIAVFNSKGEYYALANFCVHVGGPLCEGELTQSTKVAEDDWGWEFSDETVVSCPWHHWKFDIESGENIDDNNRSVPKFDTKVENEKVYVKR